MSAIEIRGLRKSYDAVEVLHGVDLTIPAGEMTVLLGPSGCGKSTLLRMIAGLESITGGEISIGGRRANDLAPKERGCAMVFQSYALYPHLTVYKNLGFPLVMSGTDRGTIDKRVQEVADMLQIGPYLQRLPKELSGGQRQRVAMGRAIIRQPSVYLFDEPLSNLDAELRVKMRLEITRLQKDLKATMVFVTHDQVEAMTLAHQIVVMRSGRIEQISSPLSVYRKPRTRFVAGFIGAPSMNFIAVGADAGSHHPEDGAWSAVKDITRSISRPVEEIGFRPEHVTIGTGGPADLSLRLPSGEYEVLGYEHLGDRSYCYIRSSIGDIAFQIPTQDVVGDDLSMFVPRSDLIFFEPEGRVFEIS